MVQMHAIRSRIIILALASVTMFAGCTNATPIDLPGSVWAGEGVLEESKQPVEFVVRFTNDGRLAIMGECNQMEGPYQLAGDRLVVDEQEWSTTLIDCDPAASANDDRITDFFASDPTVEVIDPQTFTLDDGDMELVLRRE